MKERLITLTSKEVEDAANMQKEIMEAIGKLISKHEENKSFEIIAVTLTVVICNIMITMGIYNKDLFLQHLIESVKNIYNTVRENNMYMVYKKGEKISEGRYN